MIYYLYWLLNRKKKVKSIRSKLDRIRIGFFKLTVGSGSNPPGSATLPWTGENVSYEFSFWFTAVFRISIIQIPVQIPTLIMIHITIRSGFGPLFRAGADICFTRLIRFQFEIKSRIRIWLNRKRPQRLLISKPSLYTDIELYIYLCTIKMWSKYI